MLYTNEAIQKRQLRKKKIKKITRIVSCMILIPILVYNISLIMQSIINPNKTPSFFGIKTYVIISGSMKPDYNIGDVVVAKNTNANSLKEGDVISFRQGQIIVTHRIIKVENSNKLVFKTKGDNNNAEDSGEVTANLIEGKVLFKVPWIGNIALFFRGKIAIIVLLITYYIIATRANNKDKRKSIRRRKRIEYEMENK